MRFCCDKGVPFLVTLPVAGLFTALCGAAIGRPTLRMSGLYLAIATLAFGSIVGTVFQKWTAVTGGFDGFAVPTPYVFGIADRGRDRHLLRFARGAGVRLVGLGEPASLADRARHGGDPRQRGLGAKHGHPSGAVQDAGIRRQCRA